MKPYDPTERFYDFPVITQQPRPRRRGTLSPYGWLWLSVAVFYVTFLWAAFDFLGDVSVPGEITVEWVRE